MKLKRNLPLRQCPSKYTVLDPSHTMCLEDSAHSVRRLRVNKKVKSLIVSEHNDLRRNVEPPAASMAALVSSQTEASV